MRQKSGALQEKAHSLALDELLHLRFRPARQCAALRALHCCVEAWDRNDPKPRLASAGHTKNLWRPVPGHVGIIPT